MVKILTEREREIIDKKIRGLSLSQNESNILSKYIRPKLLEIKKINPGEILRKIEYNQKAKAIEKKIKRIVIENISKKETASIIIYGSAIQNNYKMYNDIDVIIATKNPITDSKKKKEITEKIKNTAEKSDLNLDIQIYSKKTISDQCSSNPSLIYQLKDFKIIYGKMKIPKKVNPSKLDLKMKLDWSEGIDSKANQEEIYYAIRNALLILMLINKKIDNYELRKNLELLLGNDIIKKLKTNQATKSEKKLVLNYLSSLMKIIEIELKNLKWEKIEIENT